MQNKFLQFLPLIEDQEWIVDEKSRIRNTMRQCPVCAMVDVLSNGKVAYCEMAHMAWHDFIEQSPAKFVPSDEIAQIAHIMAAADSTHESYAPMRHILLQTLIHAK
jgi:hypothetical protein